MFATPSRCPSVACRPTPLLTKPRTDGHRRTQAHEQTHRFGRYPLGLGRGRGQRRRPLLHPWCALGARRDIRRYLTAAAHSRPRLPHRAQARGQGIHGSALPRCGALAFDLPDLDGPKFAQAVASSRPSCRTSTTSACRPTPAPCVCGLNPWARAHYGCTGPGGGDHLAATCRPTVCSAAYARVRCNSEPEYPTGRVARPVHWVRR
jgi:hypothetical protein